MVCNGYMSLRSLVASIFGHSRVPTARPYNAKRPYRDQFKPWDSVLSANVGPNGHPPDADPAKFHLVAPYTRDPRQWLKMRSIDIHTGGTYSITTGSAGDGGQSVRVKSYADVISDYTTHPEYKSLGPDGRPAARAARGLLTRRPVTVGSIHYICKESNRLEDVEAGTVHDLEEVLTEYEDPKQDPWVTEVLPTLRAMTAKQAADALGVSVRHAKRVRRYGTRPRVRNHAAPESGGRLPPRWRVR